MIHSLLIALHAVFGVSALALGVVALFSQRPETGDVFGWYLGSLWAMVVALVAVVTVDWPGLSGTSRAIYGALILLALYMGWRGWRALRNVRDQSSGWHQAWIDDVDFTLIALFDGFIIVGILDLGAPVWLVVLAGLLGIVIGRLGINQAKQQDLSH